MRKYTFIFSIILLGLVTMLCGGCGGGGGGTSSQFGVGTSTVSMAVGNTSAPAALIIPIEVQSIVFTITASDMTTISRTVPIVDHSTQLSVSFTVPNGQDRHFVAEALDSGGSVLYRGETSATLTGSAVSLTLNLQPVASPTGTVTGVVKDASTLIGIDGVTVTFSPQAAGGSPVVATTSGGGQYSATLPAGTYSYAASKTGYSTTNGTVTVAVSATPQPLDIVITFISTAYWTAVLNWGPAPADLDLHLYVPNGSTWMEVYYNFMGNGTSLPFATLDVDNTSHSSTNLGPETIRIYRDPSTTFFQTGKYKLFVNDFSGPTFVNDATIQLTAPDGTVTMIRLSNATGSLGNPYWYVADLDCLPGSASTLNITVKNILQTSPP